MSNTNNNMKDRVCVVTGANTGIGLEIVKGLVIQNAHVVMVCRNEEKGVQALHDIPGNPNIDLVVRDLSSVASVYDLGEKLDRTYPQIHVLIHNAGFWPSELKLNKDGIEQAFMVNHLSSFLLTHLMLDKLKASKPSRVVFVNAGLYMKGNVDLDRTPYGKDFGRLSVYCNTKLASALSLKLWDEEIRDTGVTVNMCHPGVAKTNLGDSTGIVGWLLRIVKSFWSHAEDAAKSPLWLATSDDVKSESGVYWNFMEEHTLAENATDTKLAKALWELSTKLTKLGSD